MEAKEANLGDRWRSIPMKDLSQEQMDLIKTAANLINERFNTPIIAKDITIKKIECPKCKGKNAVCAHFHTLVRGMRHPDLDVDVDDIFEICPDCDYSVHDWDQVYETNPELRMRFCRHCGRPVNEGEVNTHNRSIG